MRSSMLVEITGSQIGSYLARIVGGPCLLLSTDGGASLKSRWRTPDQFGGLHATLRMVGIGKPHGERWHAYFAWGPRGDRNHVEFAVVTPPVNPFIEYQHMPGIVLPPTPVRPTVGARQSSPNWDT